MNTYACFVVAIEGVSLIAVTFKPALGVSTKC